MSVKVNMEVLDDICVTIMTFCDFITLCSFRSTCRRYLALVESESSIIISRSEEIAIDLREVVDLWKRSCYYSFIYTQLSKIPYVPDTNTSISSLAELRSYYAVYQNCERNFQKKHCIVCKYDLPLRFCALWHVYIDFSDDICNYFHLYCINCYLRGMVSFHRSYGQFPDYDDISDRDALQQCATQTMDEEVVDINSIKGLTEELNDVLYN